MSTSTRYNVLKQRHGAIEDQITAERERPMPDALVLQQLKRQKLAIKDEMDAWERLMGAILVRPPAQAGHLNA